MKKCLFILLLTSFSHALVTCDDSFLFIRSMDNDGFALEVCDHVDGCVYYNNNTNPIRLNCTKDGIFKTIPPHFEKSMTNYRTFFYNPLWQIGFVILVIGGIILCGLVIYAGVWA